MFKLMFNKSLSVAGAFCALAMNINTALGIYVPNKGLEDLGAKYSNIVSKVKVLNMQDIKDIIQQILPCSNDPEDIISSFILVCFGINVAELAKCSPEDRIAACEGLGKYRYFNAFILNSADELWQFSSDKTYQLDLRGKGNSIIQPLSMLLEYTELISAVNLENSYIEVGGANCLSEALKVNNSLTSLNLRANDIGDSEANCLSEALKVNSSLTSLDLNSNHIGASGAGSLSEALKVNSSLTELNLGLNDIGASGAKSLSEALKVNNSLISLNLSGNVVKDSGAIYLSEALKVNSSLTELNLDYNHMWYSRGASCLLKALERNSSLTSLKLSGNEINETTVNQAIMDSPTITTLHL